MSKTRINLSIDKDLAEFAKVFAAENRTTVADVITQYILSLKRRVQGCNYPQILSNDFFRLAAEDTQANCRYRTQYKNAKDKPVSETCQRSDDGDIIKAIGYIAIYAAYIEEEIDEIIKIAVRKYPDLEKIRNFPASTKIKELRKIVAELHSDELIDLKEALEEGLLLLERRNKYLHGKIHVSRDGNDKIKTKRPVNEIAAITSAELYQLANELWDYRSKIIAPKFFRLPKALNKKGSLQH